jgi:hypothetical protein
VGQESRCGLSGPSGFSPVAVTSAPVGLWSSKDERLVEFQAQLCGCLQDSISGWILTAGCTSKPHAPLHWCILWHGNSTSWGGGERGSQEGSHSLLWPNLTSDIPSLCLILVGRSRTLGPAHVHREIIHGRNTKNWGLLGAILEGCLAQ